MRDSPIRGFTLLELMIVMAIIVAAAALVMPATGWLLRRSMVEQVSTDLTSALSLARAEAQRSGRVVDLIAVRAWASGNSREFSASEPQLTELQLVWPDLSEDARDPWATGGKTERVEPLFVLPGGLRLTTLMEAAMAGPDEESAQATAADDAPDTGPALMGLEDEPAGDSRLLIATFLPDGTGIVGVSLGVVERSGGGPRGGRAWAVSIDSWSATASLMPIRGDEDEADIDGSPAGAGESEREERLPRDEPGGAP